MSHITDLRLMITETWGFSANNCYKNIDTGAIDCVGVQDRSAKHISLRTFLPKHITETIMFILTARLKMKSEASAPGLPMLPK